MKIVRILLTAVALISATQYASAEPQDFLGKIAGAITGNSSSNSGNDSNSSDNNGGIVGAISGFVNNLISNNNFTVDDLVGTWNYTGPAVSFESDNALNKIGGAAAATAVEDKLAPYYKKLGFTGTSLVVDAEHNFTLKMGVIKLQGTIEINDDKQLEFHLNAFGKVQLGTLKANAAKSGKELKITFEATKLIQVLTKVASALNMSTLNTLSSLLNSYDGIYIGFKLKAE